MHVATVSVIIPTLNAAGTIRCLLNDLLNQTLPPDEIIVVDSSSDDDTIKLVKQFESVKLLQIARAEFYHGGTRDMALRASEGEVILFLTQDAGIADNTYVETMVSAIGQENVACVCGRQIARSDAPLYEKYTREFNYPADSYIRNSDDIRRLGIKAFFLSDACSAYRRDAYLAVGGFEHPVLTNEDMLIAAKFLRAGYRIAYCAEAIVEHSHRYTFRQEFKRNYKIGFVMRQYRRLLDGADTTAEGLRYFGFVMEHLLARFALPQCVRFCLLCTAKFFGIQTGRISALKKETPFSNGAE